MILIKSIDENIELPEGREFYDIVELATTISLINSNIIL